MRQRLQALGAGPRPGRAGCLLALGGALTGCATASDEPRFDPNPEQIAIVRTVPEPRAQGVSPNVRIDLCWSARLDPRSVSDVDATISSGNAVVDTDIQVQLIAWRGPGGTDLPTSTESSWCSGSVLSVTPEESLVGGVLHRLRLRDTPVGWEGQDIDRTTPGWLAEDDGAEAFVLEFSVVRPPQRLPGDDDPDEGAPTPKPAGPTLSALFEPGHVFYPERGQCGCHTGTDERAQALLDLSTPELAFEGLVVPGRIRDTGFPMVTPRRPSESFLLHKLLRNEDEAPLLGVLGDSMPKDADPLPYPDLVEIALWIESGAEF